MSGYEKPPGAPTFWQVIPDNGYILHAVLGERTDPHGQRFGRPRHGLWGNLVTGPTACRKVRGRDSQRFPSLRLQFSEEEEARVRRITSTDLTKLDRLNLRVPKEFTRTWADFDSSLWKGDDRTGAKRICGECATAVMREWEAHRATVEATAKISLAGDMPSLVGDNGRDSF